MKSRIFRAAQLPADLSSEWSRLLLASPTPTAFLSPQYSAVADRIFGGTYVCVIERAGEPQAFFPFAQPTRLARLGRAARPVSGALSDYVGLICREGFRVTSNELMHCAGIHSFLFTHLDSSQQAIGLTGEQPRIGLTANFSQGFETYRTEIETHNKAMRIRETRLRKLVREHGEMRFSLEHAYDANKLDLLIAQKSEQYSRTNVTSPLATNASKQFLHALAQLPPSETCTPMFSTLHCGDTMVASHFGLRCKRTLHYWFPVHDSAFNDFSPGRMLMWEVTRHAAEAGMDDMDFGEGDTPSKRMFANREHTYYRGFYTRNTPQGLADRALMSLRWRLERSREKANTAPRPAKPEAPEGA